MEQLVSAQFIAALVAAGASLIAAALSARMLKMQQRRSSATAEIEFRRRQLNDLYGPIFMRARQVNQLRHILPLKYPNGERWHLGEHLKEIHSDIAKSAIDAVDEMISIGEEIEGPLLAHSGLFVSFPPPSTYAELMTYSRMLRIAWRVGRISRPARMSNFPMILCRISSPRWREFVPDYPTWAQVRETLQNLRCSAIRYMRGRRALDPL